MEGLAALKEYCQDSLKQLNSVDKHLKEVRGKIEEQAPKEVADIYNKVAHEVIQNYYDDYKPIYYKRTGQLFKAYQVKIKKGKYPRKIYFTTQNMENTHRADNRYILESSLVFGTHGGAKINGNTDYRWGYRKNLGSDYVYKNDVNTEFAGGGRGKVAKMTSPSPMTEINNRIEELYKAGFTSIIDRLFNEYY